MHHIQWSWVFGFCWSSEGPDRETGRESGQESNCLLESLSVVSPCLKVSALLKTMGDSLSRPWNFSFCAFLWVRPGSYTIPWGFSTSTSQLVMHPFVDWSPQRILKWICHLLAAVGPLLRGRSWGEVEKEWKWPSASVKDKMSWRGWRVVHTGCKGQMGTV